MSSEELMIALEPTRRERRRLEVQGKITEAAAELFTVSGCDEVTVEEICSCADVARKTFYNYFSCKQQLILHLSQAVLTDRPREVMSEAIGRCSSTALRLQYFFTAMRQQLTSYRELERTLILYSMFRLAEDSSGGGSQIRAQNNVFLDLYSRGRVLGDVTEKYSLEFLAETTVGAINAMVINWIHRDDFPLLSRMKELEFFTCELISPR